MVDQSVDSFHKQHSIKVSYGWIPNNLRIILKIPLKYNLNAITEKIVRACAGMKIQQIMNSIYSHSLNRVEQEKHFHVLISQI